MLKANQMSTNMSRGRNKSLSPNYRPHYVNSVHDFTMMAFWLALIYSRGSYVFLLLVEWNGSGMALEGVIYLIHTTVWLPMGWIKREKKEIREIGLPRWKSKQWAFTEIFTCK